MRSTKLLVLGLLGMMLGMGGCAFTSIQVERPDGTKASYVSTRDTDVDAVIRRDADGNMTDLEIQARGQASQVNQALLDAIIQLKP